jgi:hypothetical protein
MFRSALALGLLVTLCVSTNSATRHRIEPAEGRLRRDQRVIVAKSYAVPGWTEEETRRWLDDATGPRE